MHPLLHDHPRVLDPDFVPGDATAVAPNQASPRRCFNQQAANEKGAEIPLRALVKQSGPI
jgi:hypothetical protein